MVAQLVFRHVADVETAQIHHMQQFFMNTVAPHESLILENGLIFLDFRMRMDTDHGANISHIIHISAFRRFIDTSGNIKAANDNDIR